MEGYSNHKRAIAQIAQEMGADESVVKKICDNILSAKTISQMRYPFTVHLNNLGAFRPKVSQAVLRRKAEAKRILNAKHELGKYYREKRFKKPPVKTEEKLPEYYFDLDYITV